MRHGRAEHAASTDFERLITATGRRESAEAGAWLAAQGFRPDRALVSAASRAVGTWLSVAEGADWTLTPELSEVLYGAGTDTALDLVRESPEAATSVLLLGHNPTIASLASLLDDGDADPEVSSAVFSGYPTSAVALFAYEGSWADLDVSGARLIAFHPRG